MIRRAALAAIARGADTDGKDETALSALVAFDPLLRDAARRRYHRFVEDALLAAPVGADPKHVLRLAYLLAHRARPKDPADWYGVDEAYKRARAGGTPRASRLWLATWTCVIALLAAGIAGTMFLVGAMREPPRMDATRRPAPPPTGAFATGGEPRRSVAVERLLSTDLPRHMVALSHWHRRGADETDTGAIDATAKAVMSDDVLEALGPGGARRLEQMLRNARILAGTYPTNLAGVKSLERAGEEFLDATGGLDDELAARNLGYVVDADIVTHHADGGKTPFTTAFEVTWIDVWRAGRETVRALHVKRIDRLNYGPAALGFTRKTLRDAIVLTEEIDEQVARFLLPALAGEPIDLTDDAADGAWVADVQTRAGDNARAELAGVTVDLGSILARNISRHEVQHRLDLAMARAPHMPAALAEYVGKEKRDDGDERPFATRARDELSAYLSEIARDDATPKTTLAMLSRHVFDEGLWGTAESYATLVIFEELARAAGIALPGPFVEDRLIKRDRVAYVFVKLVDGSGADLRATAKKAWEQLFDRELVELTLVR